MPAKELGSSKDSKHSETAQAVASVGNFALARQPGSSKGPRRSENAQGESTVI